MTDQLTLYLDPPRARRTDPPASQLAAARFKPGSHHPKILRALEELGAAGGTHREIARRAGIDPVAVDRRLHELRGIGRVVRLATMRGEPPAHVHILSKHPEGVA